MNLNEIAIFVRVVEAKSFSAAARDMGLPKSTVSRSVARLEDILGVKLLQRTTRKLRLTDAGLAYYERVREALITIDEAQTEVSHMQEAPSGILRITAPYDIGVGFLGEIITRFVDRYPAVQVEVDLNARMVDLIESGFDVALRATERMADSSLIARKLGETESRIFAAPRYIEQRGTPSAPEQLRDHNCVLFRSRGGRSRWHLSGPDDATCNVEVHGSVSGEDFLFVRAAALAGAGIAMMPWFLGVRDLEEGRLVQVLPGWENRRGALYLIYPPNPHLPRKVAAFRDFVIEHLTPMPWRQMVP